MILLYIDPGTGSMLFTILIGIISALIYALRNAMVKIRFLLTGGKYISSDNTYIPYVIFSDSSRYYSIFKPICDEMEKRKKRLLYITASADDPLLNIEYEYIKTEYAGDGNKAYARMNMIKADIVLSTTPGLDVYQWKRSRYVKWYVHVLHAANDATLYRMFGLDYYDALLLSGEYQINQIRQLEELRELPKKEIRLVGLPHMDYLYSRLQKSTITLCHEKTVLLAPSWGPNGILSKYGGRIIKKLVSSNYHVIIRPHPQSFVSEREMIDSLIESYPESDMITWDRNIDNFDTLLKADILISDFSGIVFDYTLVFDKPIIYADTSFDNGMCDSWWLDEKEWTFTILDKLGLQLTSDNLEQLDVLIDRCLNENRFAEGREQARSETWVNIGGAVKGIVDYMIEKVTNENSSLQ
ncbi:CDP-glycerol glycerophosphotransferase, TagB/SpsB family [Lachnospiraceae bacterium XBB2008]|nr:CDP-glycerol glycerophosphotransferase, TagB/SpsB family [Lachnospiraceae bacterium XBB2008]